MKYMFCHQSLTSFSVQLGADKSLLYFMLHHGILDLVPMLIVWHILKLFIYMHIIWFIYCVYLKGRSFGFYLPFSVTSCGGLLF